MRFRPNPAIVTLVLLAAPAAAAAPPEVTGPVRSTWTKNKCFAHDPHGYPRLPVGASDCHKLIYIGDQLVVDALATNDELGRRRTSPPPRDQKPEGFVAFLGCSFTFGEGVVDAETYPSAFAKLKPSWHAYNYGIPGGAPNTVLEQLQGRDLKQELSERRGKFVYLWISDHAWRVAGSLTREYTDTYPNYELDAEDRPVLRGTLTSAHPLRYAFYRWLRGSAFAGRLGLETPINLYRERELDLVVALFREMERTVSSTLPGSEFYLALYPEPRNLFAERFRARFRKEFGRSDKVRLIDLGDLPVAGQTLPDGHPSPEAYRALARRIATELGL